MIMFRKIRGKHLYIVISFGIGIIFAIVGLCLKRNQTALSIYKIYENIYGELILIGFLIPIFLANTLKKEKEMERTIMILAFLSKQKWCKMMIRKMSEWREMYS